MDKYLISQFHEKLLRIVPDEEEENDQAFAKQFGSNEEYPIDYKSNTVTDAVLGEGKPISKEQYDAGADENGQLMM